MRLGQVMVFAKDMARMAAFYRDGLGLRAMDEQHPEQWVALDAGSVTFALHALRPEIAAHITISDPPQRRSEVAIKYTFHVDDVAAMREHLVQLGAQMFEPWAFRDRTLCDGLDPEGNVFQIADG